MGQDVRSETAISGSTSSRPSRQSGPIVLPRPQETGAEAAKPDGDAEPPNSVAGHAMWTPAALFFLSFLFFLDCAFSLLPPSVPPTSYATTWLPVTPHFRHVRWSA